MRVFGTAINEEFGKVEETAILIAIDEILENKRVRHIESYARENPDSLSIFREVFTRRTVAPDDAK